MLGAEERSESRGLCRYGRSSRQGGWGSLGGDPDACAGQRLPGRMMVEGHRRPVFPPEA